MDNNLPVVQEVLRQFLLRCLEADQAGAIALLNASPPMLNPVWAGDHIDLGQDRWILAGMAALHVASRGGSEGLVRELLDRGANLHSLGTFGWTALHYAARGGHVAVATLLLNRGIDLHALSASSSTASYTALHTAHAFTIASIVPS